MGKETASDLRLMVREILREAMATRAGGIAAIQQPAGTQNVRIASDADLQTFIAHLGCPGVIEAVRTGSLRFALSAPVSAVAQGGLAQIKPTPAVLEGVISERKLHGFAVGSTVNLGTGAILTPLARDAGRRMGLKFERRG